MKETKKTLTNVAVMLLLFFTIDAFLGYSLDVLCNNLPRTNNEFGRMNYVMKEATPDVLILGSSRACHHYYSNLIADSLGMSVYNAGMDGRGMIYAYAVLKAVCERKAPKIVILDIRPDEIDGSWNRRVNSLRPYTNTNKEVLDVISDIDGKEEMVKCRFSSYRYNSYLFSVLKCILPSVEDTENGYVAKYGSTIKDNEPSEGDSKGTLDDTFVRYIDKFCALAKEKDVELYAVVSPNYCSKEFHDPSLELFNKNHVKTHNFSFVNRLSDCSIIFYDCGHLNHEGALLYADEFLQFIKQNYESIYN